MGEKNKKIKYISLAEATKYCDYSQEYLSLLARRGLMSALKIGRNWFTTREDLVHYIQKKAIKNGEIDSQNIALIDAAKEVGLSVDYLRGLAMQGNFPASQVGQAWFTTRKDIENYFQDLLLLPKEIKQPSKEYREDSALDVQVQDVGIFASRPALRSVLVMAFAIFFAFLNIFMITDGAMAKKGWNFKKVAGKMSEAFATGARSAMQSSQAINNASVDKTAAFAKNLQKTNQKISNGVREQITQSGQEKVLATIETVGNIPDSMAQFKQRAGREMGQLIADTKQAVLDQKDELTEIAVNLPQEGNQAGENFKSWLSQTKENLIVYKEEQGQKIENLPQNLNAIWRARRSLVQVIRRGGSCARPLIGQLLSNGQPQGFAPTDPFKNHSEFLENAGVARDNFLEQTAFLFNKITKTPQGLKNFGLSLVDHTPLAIEGAIDFAEKGKEEVFSWPTDLANAGFKTWQNLIVAKEEIVELPVTLREEREKLYQRADKKTKTMILGAATDIGQTKIKSNDLLKNTTVSAQDTWQNKKETAGKNLGLAWSRSALKFNRGLEASLNLAGEAANQALSLLASSGGNVLDLGRGISQDYQHIIQGVSNLYLVYDYGATQNSYSVLGRVPGESLGDLELVTKDEAKEGEDQSSFDGGVGPDETATGTGITDGGANITLQYVTTNGASTDQILSLSGVFFNSGVQVGELAQFARSVDVKERLMVGTLATFFGDIIAHKSLTLDQNLIVGENDLYVDTENERVGIGTAFPSEKLDVAGNLKVEKALLVVQEAHLFDNLMVDGWSRLTGVLEANGGISVDGNKFLVDGETGDIETAGTLRVHDNAWFNRNVFIGNGGTVDYANGNGDLYVQNDLEVDGTIYGNIIGAITPPGFTQGSVIFIDAAGALAEDNSNFFWDDANNRLGIGTTSPDTQLEIYGSSNKLRLSYNDTYYSDLSTGSTGDLTIDAVGGNVIFADTDTFAIGGATGQAYNVIGDATTGMSHSLASDDDLYIEGDLEVDGSAWFDASVTVAGAMAAYSVKLYDTNQSNLLSLVWNENDTSDRVLNFLVVGGDRTLTMNENLTIGDGYNVTLTALGQDNTLTLNESLTVGDGNSGTITFSGASKTLTVEDNSVINQDVTTDANPAFAGVNAGNINVGITGDNEIDTDLGNLTLDSASGTVIVDDQLRLALSLYAPTGTFAFGGADTGSYNVIGDATTGMSHSLASDDDLYIEGDLEVDGSAWFDSNVVFGSTNTDSVIFNAYVYSDIIPYTGSAYDLGTNTRKWQDVYADNVYASNLVGVVVTGSTSSSNWLINADNTSPDTEDATLTFERGTPGVNAEIRWDSSESYISTNVGSFVINPDVGITDPAVAALLINQIYNNPLISANYLGTDRFIVTNGGVVQTGDLSLGLNDTSATITTYDADEDLTIDPNGTGDLYFHGSTYQLSDSGDFTIGGRITFENGEYISNETDDLIILAGASGADNTDLYFNLDGAYPIIYSNTDTKIGIDDDLEFVGAQTISTSAGNLTLDPSGGNVALADTDTIAIGGAAGTAYNVIGDTTTSMSHSLASDDDLYIEGDLEVDGSAWFDASVTVANTITVGSSKFIVDTNGDIIKLKNLTYSWPSAHTTNGVLQNNGTGTLTWATLGASGITPDSLDFTEFQDILDLDANLTLNQTAYTWAQTYTGTAGAGFTYTASGALTSGNSAFDLNVGNSGTTIPAMMITNAGSSYALRINDDGTTTDTTPFVVDATGQVGVNTTAPDRALEVNSSTGANLRLTYDDSDGTATYYTDFSISASGDLTLDAVGGNLILADEDTIAIGGAAGTAYNVIGDATTGMSHSLASDDDLYIEGDLEVDGSTYFDGSVTVVGTFTAGTSKFIVDINGDITKINNLTYAWPSAHTASGVLTNNGTGGLTWATLDASSITADSLDFTEFQDILDLDANLTLNQTAYTWAQTYTGTTGAGFTYTASGAITSGNAAFDLNVSNASTTIPAMMITNAGSSFALRVNDDGTTTDTTPFVVDATGQVGVGTTNPQTAMDVRGTIENGLVAWWSMDEGAGSTAYDRSITGANATIANISCPSGYILVPGNATYGTSDFCVMQYEAKNSGGAVSQADLTPWVSIAQTAAITACTASGGHLITNNEWMTIARNAEQVASNWSGGSVGSGGMYRGNVGLADALGYDGSNPEYGTGRDSKASLTLSNGQVIWDLSGNVWEWTNDTCNQSNWDTGGWYEWTRTSSPDLSNYEKPNAGPLGAYTSTNGVGQYYGCTVNGNAFLRGGDWVSTANAGAFTLNLNYAPAYSNYYIGFRCVR